MSSRYSVAPTASRSLTLPEELEKLEQSITLTLQEIDHNFSRAHRIVTSSVLPIVERYAQHTDAVWEGSKFWKKFFEASANVSLSSYAQANEEEEEGATIQDETQTPRQERDPESYDTPGKNIDNDDTTNATPDRRDVERYDDDFDDTQALDSPSLKFAMGTTPQPASKPTAIADYPSPYEALKRDMDATSKPSKTSRPTPSTPGLHSTSHSTFLTHTPGPGPESSPFLPPPTLTRTYLPHPASAYRPPPTNPRNADPLLHRVLDRNYRVQATPMAATKAARPIHPHVQPSTTHQKNSFNPDLDSSPLSPALAAPPKLRAEIFGSPIRKPAAPRTPGVSVQRSRRTPARLPPSASFAHGGGGGAGQATERIFDDDLGTWDEEGGGLGEGDDDDDSLDFNLKGVSPPKTLQFHIPGATEGRDAAGAAAGKGAAARNTVLATPAREASRRIVEDLLLTAGLARGAGQGDTSTLDAAGWAEYDLGGEGGKGRYDEERYEEDEYRQEGEDEEMQTETGLLRGVGHLGFRGEGDDEEDDMDEEGEEREMEQESPSVVRVARGGFGGPRGGDDGDDVF